MPIAPALKRLLPTPPAAAGGRLADFRFAGRLAPVAAFVVLAVILYLSGASVSLTILVKLWVAYSVAFVLLACVARIAGPDASWAVVLPTSVFGAALGGVASAAVASAPDWSVFADPSRMFAEFAAGAAFSAFFVGLSLATSAVRRREQIAMEAKQQLLEARLQALTPQIEPHFLMNTLANMRYLIKADARAAVDMLDHLADLLQGALERSRSVRSTLGQEMQLVESYLAIMRVRSGDRLQYTIELPKEFAGVPFPPLLLQTLVENAVTHGIDPSEGGGRLPWKPIAEGRM